MTSKQISINFVMEKGSKRQKPPVVYFHRLNGGGKRQVQKIMRTSRKEAALSIMTLYNQYEHRPVSFKTIYNRLF